MIKKKLLTIFCFVLIVTSCLSGCGGKGDDPGSVLKETGKWLNENVAAPSPGSVGGEWAVIGLARGGLNVEDAYFDDYLAVAAQYVKDAKGVLHNSRGYQYTEYARMILGVTAAGGNAEDIGGYNFLEKLTDMKNVRKQGINGPIWTLIAYDCGNYDIPRSQSAEEPVSRESLVKEILDNQLEDGGWNLAGGSADADMTAMALTALAPYYTEENARVEEVAPETLNTVKAAVDSAIACLSNLQDAQGGFSSMGTGSSESCSQVVTALSSLGIDCEKDERFVKESGTVMDALLSYYDKEAHGFFHCMENTELNLMSTEQACYALAAYTRYQNGETRLFDMTDIK